MLVAPLGSMSNPVVLGDRLAGDAQRIVQGHPILVAQITVPVPVVHRSLLPCKEGKGGARKSTPLTANGIVVCRFGTLSRGYSGAEL